MNLWKGIIAVIGAASITACATVQPLPDEEDLPVEKIVDDAVCQTRKHFWILGTRLPREAIRSDDEADKTEYAF